MKYNHQRQLNIKVPFFYHSSQVSDSIFLGVILAMAGGFMDAYSYIARGQVFSNGQTGNLLLFGVNLASGKFATSLHYITPVIAFSLGIALTEIVHILAFKISYNSQSLHVPTKRSLSLLGLHWRQISILVECIIVVAVAFVPSGHNQLANSLTSLACGIQVESFRRIHNRNISTAMCVGNLRSAVESICSYYHKKQISLLKTFLIYSCAIFFFIVGAILGDLCIRIFSEKAMIICSAMLFIGFLLMFIDLEKN